jgi:hypothetical protein
MYSWLITDPNVNSAGLGGICFDAARKNGILQDCSTSYAGVPGDGAIAVQFDWQAPGTNGCPSVTLADGDNPVAVSVVASNGTSAFITVGASTSIAGYVVDMAFPFDGIGGALPIQCIAQSGIKYVSGSSGSPICVNAPAPQIWSDCDPNSLAAAFAAAGAPGGACQIAANKPVATRGRLYSKEAACRTTPDLRLAQGGWTLLPAVPSAAGDACNPVPAPALSTNCMFIGTTTSLGGVESPAITGVIQIPGPGAAGDKVKINNATLDQGKLNVDYSTENEMTIVGFNVYAGGTKLNASLISAKGAGSNSYAFSVGRGAVKNNRTVKVEAVLNTGATVESNTVTLK